MLRYVDVRAEPDHARAATNKKYYEDMIAAKKQQKDSSVVEKFVNSKNVTVPRDFVNYERLCRGEDTHVSVSS